MHFHLRAVCSSSFKIEAGSFQVRPVLLREHLVLCQGAPSAMLGSTGPSYYSPKHLLCTRLPFNSVSLLHHNPHITTKSPPPPLSHHHKPPQTLHPHVTHMSQSCFSTGNSWQLGNLTIQLQTGDFASDLIFNTQEFNTLLFRCSE